MNLAINLARSQATTSIYKDPSHFYMLARNQESENEIKIRLFTVASKRIK